MLSRPQRSPRARSAGRSGYLHFAKHLAVMIVLMYAGMFLLDPLYESAMGTAGVGDPWSRFPVLSNFMMAVNMTIPMVIYMLLKRHSRRAVAEMSAGMFLPAALTVGPYLLGAMTTGMMMSLSHAAMIPLMAAAMVLRFGEYAAAGHGHATKEDAHSARTSASPVASDA